MKILQTELAVTKHPRKVVRFKRGHFRGRPADKVNISEVVEERPAAFMSNGTLICHPKLYREFKAKVDLHNSEKGTFRMPPLMPMTMTTPPSEPFKIGRWDYGLPLNARGLGVLSDIVMA